MEVAATGICGSDHHLIDMGVPVTLGHEIAGRDESGAAVAVQPLDYCGVCRFCQDGRADLCTDLSGVLGVAVDGGLAPLVAVPAGGVVPLAEHLEPEVACLVEPVAVAMHAVNRASIEPASRVLVIGGGPIGLASAVIAAEGGATVDLSARHGHQRAAAERLGIDGAVGADYDVVIEAAGSESALEEAIVRSRPGATVVIPGVYWQALTLSQPVTWLMKQVQLVPAMYYGHHHGRRETDLAADLLAARPDLIDTFITHRFGLEDAAEAFRVSADRAGGAIKVVIDPR